MSTATDEEIVAAVLEGADDRYAEIVRRYQGRIVNYLYRILRNVDDAHDLSQDVFLRVYNALDRFNPEYKFSTWLFRVAQNAAIDVVRKRKLPVVSMERPDDDGGSTWEFPSGEPDAYGDARNRERAEAIESAIEDLPDEYRELIEMRHYAELSYGEISEIKSMPLGTVKNKLFRGRQLLKDQLADFITD